MQKRSMVLYGLIIVLAILLAWQWSSKNHFLNQADASGRYNSQLSMLGGIGELNSAHHHADIKVYINGKPMDFSQRKYQLTTNYMHFEDGIGDVIHIHAEGLTAGHMLNSLGINFNGQCLILEGNQYCNDANKKIKFYVNGRQRNEMYSYVMQDLDKILISYGTEDEAGIQNQIGSITNLAARYSS